MTESNAILSEMWNKYISYDGYLCRTTALNWIGLI